MSQRPVTDPALQSELDRITRKHTHLTTGLAFYELESTNDYALCLEKLGQPSGSVVITAKQSRGRGRFKRVWLMGEGDMAMSIILRPPYLPKNWALLPMISALCVVDALRPLNIQARLKWPNDIIVPKAGGEDEQRYFANFRKVGGILTENVFRENHLAASVIGIGLNIRPNPDLTAQVPHASSLAAMVPDIDRRLCLKNVLACFDQRVLAIGGADYEAVVLKEYADNCETLDKDVVVQMADQELRGRATTINANGSLVVNDGVRDHMIFAGDVNVGVR